MRTTRRQLDVVSGIDQATNLAAGPPTKPCRCLVVHGTGIVGRHLLKLGWNVHGVDLTPEMLDVSSGYYPTTQGTVEDLPFEDNAFDLAVLRQSFMLVDDDKAMREIVRVLKPGGRYILIQSVAFSNDDDEQYAKVQWARHINQKTYYTAEGLERLFEAHGLEVFTKTFLRICESVDH